MSSFAAPACWLSGRRVALRVSGMLLPFHKLKDPSLSSWRVISNTALLALGYLLSPLSWWNDLFVNVPLAYVLALPLAMINERLFLPAFLVSYWLTNMLGFVIMHYGAVGLLRKKVEKPRWQYQFLVMMAYSLVILVLYKAGWIQVPAMILQRVS